MKPLLTTAAVSITCLSSTGASAQQTCSKLTAECVAYNKQLGVNTSRCYDYKAACMRTGQWVDRNRQFSNVTKK